MNSITFPGAINRVFIYGTSDVLKVKTDYCTSNFIDGSLMSRIGLVSKNLLANVFRNFSKKDLKRTAIRKV